MAMRGVFCVFCIKRFGIGPLLYISSRSDLGFEFADIFVIEKRLPDSPIWGADKIDYRYNFFKPFKPHYIPGFFFAKLIL